VFVNSYPAGAIHMYWSSYLSLVNYNGLCDSVFLYEKLLTNTAFHLSSVVTVIRLARKLVPVSVET